MMSSFASPELELESNGGTRSNSLVLSSSMLVEEVISLEGEDLAEVSGEEARVVGEECELMLGGRGTWRGGEGRRGGGTRRPSRMLSIVISMDRVTCKSVMMRSSGMFGKMAWTSLPMDST